MSRNALHRHYDKLGPEERFRLDVLAMARGDAEESERLVNSCPRRTYTMTEVGYSGRWRAATIVTATTYADLARFVDKLGMLDAFREIMCYSRALMLNAAFDAYLDGHEAGSRHAWGYAEKSGAPPAWPDDGPNGELMEPDEDARDPAMDRDLDELEPKVEKSGAFLPTLVDRLERTLTARALTVWQAFAAVCEEEMGLEPMKVIMAQHACAEASNGYSRRIEDLLERATRLEAEADPSGVHEYRDQLAQVWAKLAQGGS